MTNPIQSPIGPLPPHIYDTLKEMGVIREDGTLDYERYYEAMKECEEPKQ